MKFPRRQSAASPIWWSGVLLLAGAVAVGQAFSASTDLRVPHRALTHNFTYGYGFSEAEADPALGMVRQTRKHAVGVITAEHAYFQVTMIVPQATTAEPVQIRLWRGRDLIVDYRVNGPEPVVRFVGVPQGDDQLARRVKRRLFELVLRFHGERAITGVDGQP